MKVKPHYRSIVSNLAGAGLILVAVAVAHRATSARPQSGQTAATPPLAFIDVNVVPMDGERVQRWSVTRPRKGCGCMRRSAARTKSWRALSRARSIRSATA